MKLISNEKLQKLMGFISERKLLNAKVLLRELKTSKDLEKMLDEEITIQKGLLKKHPTSKRPIEGKITGFGNFKKRIEELE